MWFRIESRCKGTKKRDVQVNEEKNHIKKNMQAKVHKIEKKSANKVHKIENLYSEVRENSVMIESGLQAAYRDYECVIIQPICILPDCGKHHPKDRFACT